MVGCKVNSRLLVGLKAAAPCSGADRGGSKTGLSLLNATRRPASVSSSVIVLIVESLYSRHYHGDIEANAGMVVCDRYAQCR
jgi:hypothetical protein